MLIADLQSFLKSLGAFAASQNKKSSTEEIDLLIAGLEPFREKDLRVFLQLLVHAAGVDPSTVPGLGGKKAPSRAAPKAPKKPMKTAGDAEAIAEAARTLHQLYERTTDPSLGYDEISTMVKQIQDEFDVPGFKEVAKSFGITTGISSKKACYEKIVGRISDRKGNIERGLEIAKAANAGPATTPSGLGEVIILDSEPR